MSGFEQAAAAFKAFCQTIAALRDPKTGCPWDLEQTHESLRRYMLEEAYEAAQVMHPLVADKLCDELGDVLLQVVLNAQLAEEAKHFNIAQVVATIEAKMRRRHPHVFGTAEEREQRSLEQIHAKWSEVKNKERAAAQNKGESATLTQTFAKAEKNPKTPALRQTVAIGKRAREISFDWQNPLEVLQAVQSELDELKKEITAASQDKQRIAEEMGDLFFSLGQLCRHLDIDPEVAAMDGNQKFLRRFRSMEQLAQRQGLATDSCTTAQLEELWQRAKSDEKTT